MAYNPVTREEAIRLFGKMIAREQRAIDVAAKQPMRASERAMTLAELGRNKLALEFARTMLAIAPAIAEAEVNANAD